MPPLLLVPFLSPLLARLTPLPLADMPIWLGVAGVMVSFFGTGGIILAVLKRRWDKEDKRLEEERQAHEKAERERREAEALAANNRITFEGLNMTSLKGDMTEARAQWRKDIHDQAQKHQAEMANFQLQIEEMRDFTDQLKSSLVDMYIIIQGNQHFFDSLRARDKGDGIITFQVSELPPHVDLKNINPARNFVRPKRNRGPAQEINLTITPAGKISENPD